MTDNANQFLLRHISHHKILKSPNQKANNYYDSRAPIWSNPPILETYLLKAFINCKQAYPVNEEISLNINKKVKPHQKANDHKARRRAVSAPRGVYISRAAYAHKTIDSSDCIHIPRNENLHHFQNTTIQTLYTTQNWGMNVKKASMLYLPRTTTARAKLNTKNTALILAKQHHDIIKPLVTVKKKVDLRPFTCQREENNPLSGW